MSYIKKENNQDRPTLSKRILEKNSMLKSFDPTTVFDIDLLIKNFIL